MFFKRKLFPLDYSFQLEFAGLKGKSGLIYSVVQFVKALGFYLKARSKSFLKLLVGVGRFTTISAHLVKTFLVRKLIWSRGKLGRPVANVAILTVAFIMFLTGGVLSDTKFVNSAPINPDYLISQDDIIPEPIIATTSLPEGRRTEAITHIVQPGENLSSIGSLYKVTTDALEYVNNLSDASLLKVGQKLVIPPVQGVIYKVKEGDTCGLIAKKFEVPSQAILDFNYLDNCNNLMVGRELVVPDAKIPEPQPVIIIGETTYERYVDTNPRSGWCQWPTTARIISQYYSYYHNGVDIATPWGVMPPLYACAGGIVIRAGWDPSGLGLHVIIDHGNGYQTVYGHMSKLNVSVGREVDKGDVIGLMGSTGRSTGPHVHFMVKYRGIAQNPLNYIR